MKYHTISRLFFNEAAGDAAGTNVDGGGGSGVAPTDAVPQAASVDYSRLVDASGNFTTKVAGKFTTLEGLIKSYENAEKMLANGNKVPVPNEYSSEEEWSNFYAKLGRPADPSGYTFEVDESVKSLEGVYDEEGMKAYAQLAHQVGLTPKQAQAIAGKYFEGMAYQHAQLEEQQRAAIEGYTQELAKDWGQKDSPRWKRNEQLADLGMDALGLTAEDIEAMPEARSPAFLKAMVKVAGMIKERPAAGIGGENGAQGGFGNDAQARINEIMRNTAHPYWNRQAPGHKQAVDEVERLFKLKAAESEAA